MGSEMCKRDSFAGSADVPHRFTLIFDGSEWRIDRIEALTAWTPQSDSLRALAALPAVEEPVAYDVDRLLDMQRAVITLCAARFDMLAVLALPEHFEKRAVPVSYTHLRAHETVLDLVCRLLLEKQLTPHPY